MSSTAGIVLAAGAGTRMGRPKGLLTDADAVPWVQRAVRALQDAGCRPVLVATGARAQDVGRLVPASATVVPVAGWEEGMGASLRAALHAVAGLTATEGGGEAPDAVVVTLVDMPDVTGAVVARLLAGTGSAATPQPPLGSPLSHSAGRRRQGALARASYDGVPGHPVLLGRDHWPGILATTTADAGARHYLRGRDDVVLVEAGDLASGADLDTPEDVRVQDGRKGQDGRSHPS
ncbi:nucleotidyltransferase family protein [Kineosporia sp. NBRC 101731]|uniref:nucleotidyltransferase family protein n=1 Tax=Kineosporia sp. NBRC 101731 TaxID=3032199 RepID=UPI0025534B2E|nr:nucleotidyltransferase family protein [Kineosporia sp. NBRC 101731]